MCAETNCTISARKAAPKLARFHTPFFRLVRVLVLVQIQVHPKYELQLIVQYELQLVDEVATPAAEILLHSVFALLEFDHRFAKRTNNHRLVVGLRQITNGFNFIEAKHRGYNCFHLHRPIYLHGLHAAPL